MTRELTGWNMTDAPSFNLMDRPVLEATALLCSQGDAPDDKQVARLIPSLSGEEIRQSLIRLIHAGCLTGEPAEVAEIVLPFGVLNLQVTSAGLAKLNE